MNRRYSLSTTIRRIDLLENLMRSVDFAVETFCSAREFLDSFHPDRRGCLLLDGRMPGMSGIELQKELASRLIDLPVIIVSGHSDVKMAVSVMKRGAFDCIEKPINNKHMRTLVKGILIALGVRGIMEASDGADAFKEMRHFPADIIICDWNMEPLDGLDFTRMVRTASDSHNHFIPIILLTGFTEMNRVMEARDSGISEFLAKPISAKKLYSRVKSIIENPRPFIRTTGMNAYFGPDRRRMDHASYRGAERRKSRAALIYDGVHSMMALQSENLTPEKVESLLNG